MPSFNEQCIFLIKDILLIPGRIIGQHCFLPPHVVASQNYSVRHITHIRTLPKHAGHLTDPNFITRVFIYEHILILLFYAFVFYPYIAFAV